MAGKTRQDRIHRDPDGTVRLLSGGDDYVAGDKKSRNGMVCPDGSEGLPLLYFTQFVPHTLRQQCCYTAEGPNPPRSLLA
mmetsp:Transcript_20648/g.57358  ORF Transcript_20648/g.57358 Transcript_20648/m.57358 type:complete len:80 (+) Transcript_20648:300-539(+)